MPIQNPQVPLLDTYCPCGRCEHCEQAWPRILKILGGRARRRLRGHVDHEDVAQEAAISLLLIGYKPGKRRLRSWLVLLTDFAALDYFKSLERRGEELRRDAGESVANQHDLESRVIDHVEAVARAVDLAALLKGCPPALRPMLARMTEEGLSFRAAVFELGLTAKYEALKKTYDRWRRAARKSRRPTDRPSYGAG